MKTDHVQLQQPSQADKYIIKGNTKAMLPRLPSKCHPRTSQQLTLLGTDFSSVSRIWSAPHLHSKRAKAGCCKSGLRSSLSLSLYIYIHILYSCYSHLFSAGSGYSWWDSSSVTCTGSWQKWYMVKDSKNPPRWSSYEVQTKGKSQFCKAKPKFLLHYSSKWSLYVFFCLPIFSLGFLPMIAMLRKTLKGPL